MADEFYSQGSDYEFFQSQMELLEAILEPEDAAYPWNPAASESEAYFAQREQDLVLELDEETAARRQAFFTALDFIWDSTRLLQGGKKFTDTADVRTIQATLQRFAPRIPQSWLDTIADQAQWVFSTQKSIAHQLVECVQELVPNWSEEDLLVLARPFANVMRGTATETVDFVLGKLQHRDWTALTEIEQARAGLAIARYALDQIQNQKV